jgi:hypothetical protein
VVKLEPSGSGQAAFAEQTDMRLILCMTMFGLQTRR